MATPPNPWKSGLGSLAGDQNISRTKWNKSRRLFLVPIRFAPGSGFGALAVRIIGPIAVEPGHAPFDALAGRGKTAVFDDRVMHGARLAVVDHDVGAAVAARNIVGCPGPER